jgi:hypothetical protein
VASECIDLVRLLLRRWNSILPIKIAAIWLAKRLVGAAGDS